MPADLEMLEDGSASMFYTDQEVPWHGLGTPVSHVLTAEEAMSIAHLDWEVELTPAFTKFEGKFKAIPNRVSVTRTSDGKSLGVVSDGYKPIQNADAFKFFDTLIDDGEAKYETAGSLSGGKRIWMTAKIGDTIQIAGDDPHDMYLLLVNSHDGTKALQAVSTMIRVVCSNTEQMAIRGAKTAWSLTHRRDLAGRVLEARDALAISFKYQEAFNKEVEKLLAVEMTTDKFKKIMTDLLPEQKHATEKKITSLVDLFENSTTIKGTSSEGTGYGAFNALSEYMSHKERQTEEAKMIYNVFGQGVTLRNNLRDAVLASA